MDRDLDQDDQETLGSTQECRFYTYAWLRENGTPFYVGKGCGSRAWVKHRNWDPPPKDRILILKSSLTEEEAYKHEVYMIFVLGRKFEGGLLHNCHSGGSGGFTASPETLARMSAAQKGRIVTPDHRQKISESLKHLPPPRWYNKDGHNIMVRDGHPPEGYVPGRALSKDWGPSDRKGRVWWNNGEREVWREVKPDETWLRGRLKRSSIG